MREFFKKINIFKILIAVALMVLGICLICLPDATLLTLCYIISGFIIFFGICSVVNYFIYGFEPFGFVYGIAEIALGIVFAMLAPQIVSPQVFSIIVGVILLLSGLFKVQDSMDYRRFGDKYWWVYLIYALVLVALSIVLLVYPFAGQKVLLIFVGVSMIVDGVMKIISMILVKSKIRKFKKGLNEDIIDIE